MQGSRLLIAAFAGLLASTAVRADVTLPKIFGDNMVLQRERPVAVWGAAAPGEEVTVRFAGQEKKAKTAADGRWQVALDALKASSAPAELTVEGANKITLKNILVGEVWFCSGQSNMEYAVGVSTAGASSATSNDAALVEELKSETYPQIRLFRVEKQTRQPEIVTAGWTDCGGGDLAKFSAIGFFFARNLQRELGVPVGMIGSYWGGSRLEQWTPPAAYLPQPAFAQEAATQPLRVSGRAVGDYYNSMIRDLAPFMIRGVLWYQGESNIIASNDGVRYADKMQALVDFWRAQWQDKALPFYQVQLAPFRYSARKQDLPPDRSGPVVHSEEELPKLWEAQMLATRIPGVGLVPTTDLDANFSNIHPSGKRAIGTRLANLALTNVYGKTMPASQGPVFERLELKDGRAIVHFSNAGAKLSTRDGQAPAGFEIAAADGVFKPAAATISGDTVVLEGKDISLPVFVRMGWTETSQPNLINPDGLPAYPFRSNGPDWKPAP